MTGAPEAFDFITAKNDADIENLITVIYHKTRVQVSRDDPLLSMYYVNCFMAGRLEESMRQVMEEYNRRMLDLTSQVNADAVANAEKIVNGAIKAAENIVHAAIMDSASAIKSESIKALQSIKTAHEGAEKEVDGLFGKVRLANASLRKNINLSVVASLAAAVAGIAALIVSLLR